MGEPVMRLETTANLIDILLNSDLVRTLLGGPRCLDEPTMSPQVHRYRDAVGHGEPGSLTSGLKCRIGNKGYLFHKGVTSRVPTVPRNKRFHRPGNYGSTLDHGGRGEYQAPLEK